MLTTQSLSLLILACHSFRLHRDIMFIPLSLSVTTGITLLTTFASFISISGAVSIPRDVFPTKVEARDGPVTMMIVGDSISQGHEGEYTWRGRLMVCVSRAITDRT